MAKRIAICPITLGTPGGPPNQGNRPSLADVLGAGGGFNAIIPTKPDGSPKYRFCFVQFVTAQLTTVAQLPNIYLLPDYGFDSALDGMGADSLNTLVQNVPAYDLDGNGYKVQLAGTYQGSDSYRSLLERIGKTFDASFDLNHFDVQGS